MTGRLYSPPSSYNSDKFCTCPTDFGVGAGQLILHCLQNMYEKLQKWSRHHNKEVYHLGMAALEAFLKQVTKLAASSLISLLKCCSCF